MRLRPLQVFAGLLPFTLGLFWFHGWDESRRAQDLVASGPPLAGRVLAVRSYPRRSWKVDLSLPGPGGATRVELILPKRDHEAVPATLEVYAAGLPGGGVTYRTAASVREAAGESTARHLAGAALFGLPLAGMLYYLLVRIPFGAPRRSLHQRWREERPAG